MHIYDYIIIGSGLTGLTIAQKLSQETSNILVLEAHDFIGGDNRSAKLNDQEISNGLRFFPATESSTKSIEFLESILKTTLVSSKKENNPESYEASGFKRFVGFGDKSVEFYDQLSYFLSSEEYVLTEPPHVWIQKLQENLTDKIQTKSIVTKFGFETFETEKPQLTHVVVNGTKQIHARNFIFAGPVKDLGLLLNDDILSLRAKAKLKKVQAWQAVCLDLFHTAASEKNNLFVLNGTTDDEIGPCLGRFHAPQLDENQQTSGQFSQWLSFVDAESAEDTENIGLVLKKMKRQIKRAFPEISDSVKKERIFVTTALSGSEIKLTGHLTIPQVENLWIASPQVSKSKNLLASLQQAQMVLAAMGFASSVEVEAPNQDEALAAEL
jgi:protoporphyrinogen oxidase